MTGLFNKLVFSNNNSSKPASGKNDSSQPASKKNDENDEIKFGDDNVKHAKKSAKFKG